ncbi:MAG: hypothetical protein JSV21_10905 [Nitrospirota bacterium]|nr:MAG: hypothetical protein JSV21_10905 [Nitrospirota bacterium]
MLKKIRAYSGVALTNECLYSKKRGIIINKVQIKDSFRLPSLKIMREVIGINRRKATIATISMSLLPTMLIASELPDEICQLHKIQL